MGLEHIRKAVPQFPIHPRPIQYPDDPTYFSVLAFAEEQLAWGMANRESDLCSQMQLKNADARMRFFQRHLFPDARHARHLVVAFDQEYDMAVNYGTLQDRENIEAFKSRNDIDVEIDHG